MRLIGLLLIASCSFASGRVDTMKFDDDGTMKLDDSTKKVLDFPAPSTAYTFGDKFRTLFELEMWRYRAIHADIGYGEQFVGASVGMTLGKTGIGNFSVLGGYGYDLDDKKTDFFAGFSHRSSLLGLSDLKTFGGWDILLGRLRYGAAYEIWEWKNWNLDIVGTSKLMGRRNFLGGSLGYDWFEGAGGGSKTKLEADLGIFGGWDFDEIRSNGKKGAVGAGLSANIRF